MPEAVIVSALRTPIGTAFKGTLRDTTAYELAHHVVSQAAAELDSIPIDDVILGGGSARRWCHRAPRRDHRGVANCSLIGDLSFAV